MKALKPRKLLMWGILGTILGVFLLSQLMAQRLPSPGDWECQVLNKPDPLKFTKFDLKRLLSIEVKNSARRGHPVLLRGIIRKEEKVLARIISRRIGIPPGGKTITRDDIRGFREEWWDEDFFRHVIREGKLPEGKYEMCVFVLSGLKRRKPLTKCCIFVEAEIESQKPPSTDIKDTDVEVTSQEERDVSKSAKSRSIYKEDGTWLWLGFHHEWKTWPHRFRDIYSKYYSCQYQYNPDGASKLSGNLVAQQTVGKVKAGERLIFWTYKKGIKTGVAEFREGSVSVISGGPVGERTVDKFPTTIGLEGLEKYENVTLFMRGFRISEDNPDEKKGDHAYPIQGFGIKADQIERRGNSLYFLLHVMTYPSGKPGNTKPKPDPARFKVEYFYTLVGGNEGDVAFTHGHKYYHGPHSSYNEGDCPRASAETRNATIQGVTNSNFNQGVVVFRGFFITINSDTTGLSGDPKKHRGRLIRQIDVAIKAMNYFKDSGKITFFPDIYFCNKSGAQYAINTYYQCFVTLLQFKDPNWRGTSITKDAGDGAEERSLKKDTNFKYKNELKSATFQSP
ncbi:MAG: hypothetical protein JSV88_29100 [Candidatus Aminicenantes bacterium]|nr:MAG: hypothetical protein JSV88_29100 [Candidatus Aminicenantes bacterium]